MNTVKTREALFIRLYEKAFPKTAAFICKMGGNLEEARDVFQDALIAYYEHSVGNKPVLHQNEEAYLTGICKHLWYKKYHHKIKQQSLQSTTLFPPEEEPEVSESILDLVERSGKKCLELLKGFYYDKLNMKELALKFGFSGERSATAQKFKCLQKVRLTVKKESLKKEDFYA